MRRRDFIKIVAGLAAVWPLAARAQASPKGPTIAWIGTSPQLNASFIENFLRGMRELGYAEGRNFDMLYRFTDGYQERLPALTEEVIRLKPDVILAAAVIYAVAARKATSWTYQLGVDLRWCYYRGAYFVDRILRGTAPGDLPIEFPTQMFLAVNLKTASALGITVQPTLLARADEVIANAERDDRTQVTHCGKPVIVRTAPRASAAPTR
jgi:hypothetical protein